MPTDLDDRQALGELINCCRMGGDPNPARSKERLGFEPAFAAEYQNTGKRHLCLPRVSDDVFPCRQLLEPSPWAS